jgi:hypothetical protein
MNQFVVYNNKRVYFIDAITLEEATAKAISICDSSHEIIVREVEHVKFFLNNIKIDL